MAQYKANLYEAIHNDDIEYFTHFFEILNWPRTRDTLDIDLLNEALEYGSKDIVNYLLDKNCRLTSPKNEVQPLHLAVGQPDFYDIVKRLVALGARVSERNVDGDNAVHLAFVNGAPGRTIDLLLMEYLKETSENAKNEDGLSVLHIICARPNVLFLKEYVKSEGFCRSELNCQVDLHCGSTFAGYTPLHFAISNCRKEIAKFLVINYDVDAFIQDANNSTPLHLALERRDVHAIDLIVAYNFPNVVRKDYVNCNGLSHFMAACIGNIQDSAVKFMQEASIRSAESLQILVNRQVNEDSPPYAGYSPMHFAAEFGRTNTVHQLVFHGASLFIKSAEDFTPLVVAVKHGHDEIARLLFWCYKQYRRTLFEDREGEIQRENLKESVDQWYPCQSFSALKV